MESSTIPRTRTRRRRRSSGDTEWVLTLESGGTVTLTASVDIFIITPADRALIFSLIDKMREHHEADRTRD